MGANFNRIGWPPISKGGFSGCLLGPSYKQMEDVTQFPYFQHITKNCASNDLHVISLTISPQDVGSSIENCVLKWDIQIGPIASKI